ncbi:hypothetical protein A3751_20805 [Oleiphilus sp. HI0080]|uniref:glycosyltransferase n=1 Tax=Oleiphilus sp. HI0080 TaxID=1822255 RepID=UPI0007C30656|nr:glycosyltransferase [Oleiphilus sp. HI0080]KZZ19446.1 hypothetical protein A3751_20805 [Oleiphilus sp. HI0080]
MIEHVSAVIIVKNAADTIRGTLESLRAFQEVVLYDNGSSDDTLSIASEYPNVLIFEGQFVDLNHCRTEQPPETPLTTQASHESCLQHS